jgi:hypothetical protein
VTKREVAPSARGHLPPHWLRTSPGSPSTTGPRLSARPDFTAPMETTTPRAGIEPVADVIGQSDPFQDLWCYTNPISVDV